jgi:DMSO/TMAO reductase YedYZ molybdopterin-dependent catalytic subunit
VRSRGFTAAQAKVQRLFTIGGCATREDEVVQPERPVPSERRLGRATFLGVTAVGLSSLVWGRSAWETAARVFPDSFGEVLPQPTSGWRIYTVAATMPRIDPELFRLEVAGEVERPLSLSLADLRDLPRAKQVSDFECVTGWKVEDVRWEGVRLGDVLEPAGVRGGAGALAFVSAEEPYVDSLTLEQAMEPDAMLAYAMDGRPLKRPHGAPARVVMPKMYGYKNVKWVERIVVTRTPLEGYWEERGYDRDAWIDD